MYDPYAYFLTSLNQEEEENFLAKESRFYQSMLLRSDMTTK